MKKENCNDKHCPSHGSISTRGRSFVGDVTNVNIHKTITVEWPRQFYLKKYERFEKRRTRIKAHKPDCIEVEVGDKVKVMETRPIAKTKNFVVVEVLSNNLHTKV